MRATWCEIKFEVHHVFRQSKTEEAKRGGMSAAIWPILCSQLSITVVSTAPSSMLYGFFLPSSSMYFVACFLLCHSIRIEDQVDVGIVD